LKQRTKLILISILSLFVIIQLFPVERENPSTEVDMEIGAPPEVKMILKNSCYDCHSNQTHWPFYSYIAPISWLVAHDVEDGRKDLNFSEWNKYPAEKIEKLKSEIQEEVLGDEMPLGIYTLIHPSAKLSEDQKNILKKWTISQSGS
jgi:hypothetical protein